MSSDIDDVAALWAVRAQEGGLTPGQDAEFQTWLNADHRHQGAYVRASAVLAHFDRAQALASGPAPTLRRGPTRRQWLVGGGAIAACVGAGVLAPPLLQRTSTGKGEVRVLALQDGSHVALDTLTAIRVSYTDRLRQAQLFQGEALFDIVKDAARPFVVQAAQTLIRTDGASFSVRFISAAVIQVLVRQGQVEVTRMAGGAAPQRRIVAANTQAVSSPDQALRVQAQTPEAVEKKLAWREGMLDFDAVTLSEAAEQFTRYSDYRLDIDPDVAGERISGRFSAQDPKGFAIAASESLDIHIDLGAGAASLHR